MASARAYSALFLIWALALPVSSWAQEVSSPSLSPSRPGPTINGATPVDPSENVKALNEAANKRQDDLRIAAKELSDAKLQALSEINMQRSRYDKELLSAATNRLDSEAKLRADFAKDIAATEKARVDAIRLVDKNAVDVATAQAVATATALAKTVQDTATLLSNSGQRQAEDLRKLVETTALETNRNIQQQFGNINTGMVAISGRLTNLEQAGAEGKGRQAPPDPIIATLLQEVRSLRDARSITVGTDAGRTDVVGWVVGGLALLIAFSGLLFTIIRSPKNGSNSRNGYNGSRTRAR